MSVSIHDETLRDGLQSPSVVDPELDDKIRTVHLLEDVGVDSVCVGYPGAGPRAFEAALRLTEEIERSGLRIQPGCAARTTLEDLAPIAEIAQRTGHSVEALTFIGSSPIRQLVEDWSVALVRRRSVEAIAFADRQGLVPTYVTEDTTRSRPEVLRELFRAAIEHGARRLCLCDTVGHATPRGVSNLVEFTHRVIHESGAAVGIDWHGHNDRGLALDNTVQAYMAGADRLHGCVLGLGERVGNAALELLLMALELHEEADGRDLTPLPALCRLVSRATHRPLPPSHPLCDDAAQPPVSQPAYMRRARSA